MVGKLLSHYRIVEELGRGGMGIVYKAEDTSLDRTVAIKVLPPAALSNEDDRARFYREAKAAAQLQHPNICSVYQIDEATPVDEGADASASAVAEVHPFIAMEYIDGVTLSERIKEGPLRLGEAIRIITGITDALKLAHSKDIVHRDIKSSNIMLDTEGRAKVLDFGLAKTAHSTMLTRMGSTIGTVAYMSPEQAKGEDVDSRTDLWALGVVMHELVTGKLPFGGDYEQAIVYSILNEANEPLTAVRTGVPMELERIVNKMLAKQADLRYQTAADLMADLKAVNLQASTASMPAMSSASMAVHAPAAVAATTTPARKTNLWLFIVAGLAAIALGIIGYVLGSAQSTTSTPSSYERMNVVISGIRNVNTPTASPNGKYWAMMGVTDEGEDGLFIYDTEEGTHRMIPNSAGFGNPMFSPEGNWLLAYAGRGNPGLYRIQVPRGQPVLTYDDFDATWKSEEELLIANDTELIVYNITTDSENVVATADTAAGYDRFFDPAITSNPNKVIVAGSYRESSGSFRRDLLIYDIDSGVYSLIEENANSAVYYDSGHLIYDKQLASSGWQLTMAPFDVKSGSFTGPSTSLEDPWSTNVRAYAGSNHSLFILPARFRQNAGLEIGWFDPENSTFENVSIEPGLYGRVAVSPTGDAIAIESTVDDATPNIVTLDLATSSLNRMTYTQPVNTAPVYGPVSGRLYYVGGANVTDPNSIIYVKNADGSGAEEIVVENGLFPAVSPDEKWIAFARYESTALEIIAMNLDTREEIIVEDSRGNHSDPMFSPDGKYIIYNTSPDTSTNITNQSLFIRSFPDVDQYFRKLSEDIPVDDPVWSSDGQYIYFETNASQESRYSRIAVSLDGGFSTRSRVEPVDFPALRAVRSAADPNSHRILMNYNPQQSIDESPFDFHVIQNFPALLREIAPPSR